MGRGVILNWYEALGTLSRHGLFNEDLPFDWIWAVGVWHRVKSNALGLREAAGVPARYENFEALAEAHAGWTGADRGAGESLSCARCRDECWKETNLCPSL